MPIPITCSSCNATDCIADGLAGTVVACRQCGTRLAVPGGIGDGETGIRPPPLASTRARRGADDFDDGDVPHRSIAKPRQSGSGWFWVIGGGVLALGCLGCMGIGIGIPVLAGAMGWWGQQQVQVRAGRQGVDPALEKKLEKALNDAFKDFPKDMPVKEGVKDFRKDPVKGGPTKDLGNDFAVKDRFKDGNGGGRLIINQQDQLTPNDPVRDFKRHKAYQVRLEQGRTYVIDMISGGFGFDPYLRLYDPTGLRVAEDDDGGGYPNARIRYIPTQSGVFTIAAASFNEVLPPGGGNFHITVRQE